MTAPAPRRVLFVCSGNTCRSPMARALAERLARETDAAWEFSSAGTSAVIGAPLSPGAARALAARGISEFVHASRPLSAADVDWADRVYAMTEDHRAAIAARFPRAAAKIRVLRRSAGFPDADIEDPIGGEDEDYRTCAARIEEALAVLIKRSHHAENTR